MMALTIAMQVATFTPGGQAYHDGAAAQIAASMHGSFRTQGRKVSESRTVLLPGHRSSGWRTITDEELRRRSSYHVPAGYRFRRKVNLDLDLDGHADVVEMIERAGQTALRITYGGLGWVVVTNAHPGRWTDQGLFAAGTDAVMVNFPESGTYFLFERRRRLWIEYVGD